MLSLPFRKWIEQAIDDLGAAILPITVEYAEIQAGLPKHAAASLDHSSST